MLIPEKFPKKRSFISKSGMGPAKLTLSQDAKAISGKFLKKCREVFQEEIS